MPVMENGHSSEFLAEYSYFIDVAKWSITTYTCTRFHTDDHLQTPKTLRVYTQVLLTFALSNMLKSAIISDLL